MNKSCIALSALLSLAPLAMAQLAAGPTDLGTLGGTQSTGYAIASGSTPADLVVGTATTTGDAVYQGFFGTAGSLTSVGSLYGPILGNSNGGSVDSAGANIGGSTDFNDPINGIVTHAFYYNIAGTTMNDLGTLCATSPCGTSSWGYATQNGLIAGVSEVPGDTATSAVYWNWATSTLTALPTLGGALGAAYGINATGQIVGNSGSTGGAETHTTYWDTTKPIITATYLGSLGGSYGVAYAINNSNVVVGYSTTTGDKATHAFVWQHTKKNYSAKPNMTDIKTLGGDFAQANAVNNATPFVVVGSSNVTGNTDVHAFQWTSAGGMVDLNSLLPNGSGWDLQSANAIADDGTIVGVGVIDGQAHAFQWNTSLP